jgi:hypothetical protein
MPLINVIEIGEIPAAVGRKALILQLKSGDCNFGESGMTGASDTPGNSGIAMTIGVPIALTDEEHKTYQQPIGLYSVGGAVISYQNFF